jgi:hypothetical protein
MRPLFDALWHGILDGASTRTRSAGTVPAGMAASGTLRQGLYRLGYEVANIVVFGRG